MDPIIQQYMVLVEKISNTTKRHHSFGTDVNIYRSEIHIIQLIGDCGSIYISEISRQFGVTKGTVSQIVKRLEKKGLVHKFVDEDNNTRQLVNLTEKGSKAYAGHVAYHHTEHEKMKDFLDSLSTEHKRILEEFLTMAYEMVDNHL